MTGNTADKAGKRLDAWLADSQPDLSRARWQALIKSGAVTVNGRPAKPNCKLSEADRIDWTIPPPVATETLAEDIPLQVLFEDRHLIVINKPAGLVVHPAAGNPDGTLVNALLHHCKDLTGIGGEERPGIVHRLDKDTSGVMVVAKTEQAMTELARQFKERETEKEYLAIVRGVPEPPTGRVDAPIGRHPVHRKKMAVNARHSRHAVSSYQVLEGFRLAALVRVRIETGRTHQIRVHMAHLRHPIVGDTLYGRSGGPDAIHADRQMLHAAKLSIAHPDTGERLYFSAPLPPDMEDLLERLRRAGHEHRRRTRPSTDF